MRPRLEALIAVFAQEVDDLITELVEERVGPIKLALEGLALPPGLPAAGRPAKYSASYQARLLGEMAGGTSARAISKREGIPRGTLLAWRRARRPKKAKVPKPAKVAKAAGKGKTPRRVPDDLRAKIVKEATAPGAVLNAIEKKYGLSASQLHKWGVRAGGKVVAPVKKERKRTRTYYAPDYRRAMVAKLITLAPPERGLALANEGVDPELFRKWVKWVKQNPA